MVSRAGGLGDPHEEVPSTGRGRLPLEFPGPWRAPGGLPLLGASHSGVALLSKLKAQRPKGCARLCGTRGGGQKLRKWLMQPAASGRLAVYPYSPQNLCHFRSPPGPVKPSESASFSGLGSSEGPQGSSTLWGVIAGGPGSRGDK